MYAHKKKNRRKKKGTRPFFFFQLLSYFFKIMSLVNILNIQVLDNPTAFTNPFQFEITFECNAPLEDGKLTSNKKYTVFTKVIKRS